MEKYIKMIIGIFINNEIVEENEEIKLNNVNIIKWSNIGYIIGTISLIGIGIFIFNNYDGFNGNSGNINNIGHLRQLDEVGEMVYKFSSEISKTCTVRSWETIHKVLKDLDMKTNNKNEIINELEQLLEISIKNPAQFSRNSECFEKSLIKFIQFLKEIL